MKKLGELLINQKIELIKVESLVSANQGDKIQFPKVFVGESKKVKVALDKIVAGHENRIDAEADVLEQIEGGVEVLLQELTQIEVELVLTEETLVEDESHL